MPTPKGPRSPQAYDGVVPGTTWAQFISGFKASPGATTNLGGDGVVGDPSTLYLSNLPGYGGVVGRNTNGNFYGTNPDGSNADPTIGGGTPAYDYYTNDLGDGTRNEFSEGDDGSLVSKNVTQNNDSWWDSTGLPLVVSLAAGAGIAGLASAGVGFAGAGAGATGEFAAGAGAGLGGGTGIGAGVAGAGESVGGGFAGLDAGGGGVGEAGAATEFGGDGAVAGSGGATVLDPVSVVGSAGGGGIGGLSGAQLAALAGAGTAGIAGAAFGGGGGSSAIDPTSNFVSPTDATQATTDIANSAPNITQAADGTYSVGGQSGLSASQATQLLSKGGGLLSSLLGGGGGTSGAGGATSNPSILNGLLQGIGGVISANDATKLTNQIVQTADPFHNYRNNYAQDLNSFEEAPGYAAQFQPTALSNYINSNTPGAAISPLTNYQADPALASSLSAVNGSVATNAPEYNALNGVGAQYADLLKNPSDIFNDPAYQAQTAQGQESVQRALAQRGQTGSGNELQALQDYGTANSAQYYSNRLNQLGTGYNQNLSALGGQTAAGQNAAQLNLSNNAQGIGLASAQANAGLSAQQSGYNQQSGLFSQQLTGNTDYYNQLAQLSGLSQANLGSAATALGKLPGQVAQGYANTGAGIGQILNAGGGLGGLFNSLGNGLSGLFGNSTQPISNSYYAPDGLDYPTDAAGNLQFDI